MKSRRWFALAVAACLTGCGWAGDSPAGAEVKHVDPDTAEKLVQSGKVIVLDVRTPEEFAEGRIGGAKNLDFLGNTFEQQVAALDRNQPYLVHCAAGGRSTGSLAVFRKLGFSSIYHLDGGFGAWADAGKPVTK